MWLTLLGSLMLGKPDRRGDISVKTIVIIIISIAILVLLLYIATTKGQGMFDIWEKGPFG